MKVKIIILCILIACLITPVMGKMTYPKAHKVNISDDYFGTKVPDPYRWLEDPNSSETVSWVKAQNELTAKYLNTREREKIKEKLTKLWNYPKYSIPRKKGDRYFFSKNDGLQNQAVVYMQKGLQGKPQIILNPNEFSKDGTVSLSSSYYSHDGTLLAYGTSKSGSDWQEIKIRNIDTGQDYDEILKWSRGGGVAWKHDNSGFYYNRYPEPGTVSKEDETKYNRVYWHKLGTPQGEDILIYERQDKKDLSFYPFITEDGKYLVLYVYRGTDVKNRIYYRPVDSNGDFIRLLDNCDASYDFIDNVGPIFYFKTDLKAPRSRIIAIDLNKPGKENWKEIIPQKDDTISYATMVNNSLVIDYMHNVCDELRIFDLKGKFINEITLPSPGSIGTISGEREDNQLFYSFTSFLYPTTIFQYNFKEKKSKLFRKSEISFDPSPYVTKQVFYTSKDGTKIPMFITYKKGISLHWDNPVLLYGYGGFSYNITPSFSISNIIWLEHGGIYAVANIRGGAEFGEKWHEAGKGKNKQNVFDDFISAAEWLIKNRYTKPPLIAINGASNGGLLVAACMVQRPRLFGAVICQVPLTDMLRYTKFTVGHYWLPEYGDPFKSAEEFKVLYAYSPLHNVKTKVHYPPALILTADCDDRVASCHAKKFVATLQAKNAGSDPILLKVETKAGHGGGKPTSKVIDEQADIYAFLFKTFGMKW